MPSRISLHNFHALYFHTFSLSQQLICYIETIFLEQLHWTASCSAFKFVVCDDHSKSKCLRTNVLQKTISVSSLALNIRRIHPASALHFIAKLTIYTWKLVSLLISMSRLNTHFDSGIAIFSRAIVYCLHVIELCVPVTQGFHACHPQPTCILCPHLVADVQNLFLSEIFVIYGKKIG